MRVTHGVPPALCALLPRAAWDVARHLSPLVAQLALQQQTGTPATVSPMTTRECRHNECAGRRLKPLFTHSLHVCSRQCLLRRVWSAAHQAAAATPPHLPVRQQPVLLRLPALAATSTLAQATSSMAAAAAVHSSAASACRLKFEQPCERAVPERRVSSEHNCCR